MALEFSSFTPTSRFLNRVENYVKYRPGYPQQIIPFLEQKLGLQQTARIADIGSGTGLFAEPLLAKGYRVICIEPNEAMRKAGEERLRNFVLFTSRRHRAEATGLRSHSIDLITVAQAFHWMNVDATRKEFLRILKPGGNVVLAWNLQKTDNYFLQKYTDIKERYRIEETDSLRNGIEQVSQFFGEYSFQKISFPNLQLLDFDSLKGQLLSCSYIPLPGHQLYETMISELVQLFVHCNENGFVRMEFETVLYCGVLN